MTGPRLDPEATNAGAMERLMIVETATPAKVGLYNQNDSLKAMRLMRQVIENRLKAPARFGARGATDEIGIVSVGNQFAGFGEYPTLSAQLRALLAEVIRIASSSSDKRSVAYARFVDDTITASTEPTSVGAALYPNLAAWRTAGATAPGGNFRFLLSLQGNDFYTADPVPPMPKHGAHHRRDHH